MQETVLGRNIEFYKARIWKPGMVASMHADTGGPYELSLRSHLFTKWPDAGVRFS